MYSFELRSEAACCLWEALVEWQCQGVSNEWTQHRARVGTMQARHDCIALADTCHRAWDALSEDERIALMPYDWEFCPALLLAIEKPGEVPKGAAFAAVLARLRAAAKEAAACEL
ncbi:hypothetical protein ACVIF9_008057 [Bradyrhizobium sp. USDA 4350]